VTSLPKTPRQHWHRDAAALYDFDFMPAHLPSHGVVVFVPLTDVRAVNGPTEFLTKSHRSCYEEDE